MVPCASHGCPVDFYVIASAGKVYSDAPAGALHIRGFWGCLDSLRAVDRSQALKKPRCSSRSSWYRYGSHIFTREFLILRRLSSAIETNLEDQDGTSVQERKALWSWLFHLLFDTCCLIYCLNLLCP